MQQERYKRMTAQEFDDYEEITEIKELFNPFREDSIELHGNSRIYNCLYGD